MKLDLGAFQYLAKGSFWLDLWNRFDEDDCWGLAAQLSFYFLLAFFPFLIFLGTLFSFVSIDADPLQTILVEMDRFLPQGTSSMVRDRVMELTNSMNRQHTGLLSLGILMALWSASLGFSGMTNVLNRSGTKETRSWVKTRSLAILVTVVVSILILISEILILFGGWVVSEALTRLHLGTFYSVLWQFLRWVLIFVFLNVGIETIYFSLSSRRLPWRLMSPGGVTAASGWIFGSMGFTFYVNYLADYERLYGRLGALIVLMLWFYLSSLLLLLGGEINSTIFQLRKDQERVKF